MLIFKEPQRQRLETKPHSSGVHPGLRPQPFPLPLPWEGTLCGLASCGSSLQCCELNRADLFLHPHPCSNLLQRRIKGVIPETLVIPRKRATGPWAQSMRQNCPCGSEHAILSGWAQPLWECSPSTLPFLNATPGSGSPARAMHVPRLPDAQRCWSGPAVHTHTAVSHVG